ncbi:hypothetical protein RND71_004050 [Anisodus tanguticus]|uniref:Uncharacterized protein n=1 Tax=Anisodus tanguticus TaxID=243964 RepID=A0AAE1VX39_9SOLA|nr:hypothetical protein RND71_004050 [Anisodus tanguticus]
MTQVDLESLNSTNSVGNKDRKIVCETLANTAAGEKELPPDFPPESICLSKDAELDWFDRNAFLERKESAKGNSNVTPNLHSSSQRLPLTLKTTTKTSTFFGLPKSSSVDSKRKTCKPVNIRFFPTKRSESALKAVSEPEPVSPKVSCMGRVRSKKSRRREPEKICEIKLERSKTGFYSRVLSIFRFNRRKDEYIPEELPVQPKKSKAVSVEPVTSGTGPEEPPVHPRKSNAMSVEPVIEGTGLGGMMRFTSGRRSETWAADEIDAVLTELGSDRKVGPNKRN